MKQKHLSYDEMVNLGSYYTNQDIVDICYNLIKNNIKNTRDYILIDSSCGYGSFLTPKQQFEKIIGADIDNKSINYCKTNINNCTLFNHNSLHNVSRKQYNLKNNDKIIIIGNPPYNDTTSQSHKNIKNNNQINIDKDLVKRDLGMSFLLSYKKLNADYICVLHPLSYLIKKTNFNYLRDFFTSNCFQSGYKLIDCHIISSSNFELTSKKSQFPIIIALYKQDDIGMNYQDIQSFKFKTDNNILCLNNFDYISQYVDKYPNKKKVSQEDIVARFYTLRDINALKRSATFINNDINNTVYVLKDKFKYYCYIDIFKDYCDKIPYYMGNIDIIINNEDFLKISNSFIQKSLNKYGFLNYNIGEIIPIERYENDINMYFNKLFMNIYEYNNR